MHRVNENGEEKENLMYEHQVALSFAGEDRQYAEKLAKLLSDKGIEVFYDWDERANLWGKDLYQHLQAVYRDKAQFVIVFISQNYLQKRWTQHELKQIQARAFEENREYILPLRLDDTDIPGINRTTGYIDLRATTLEETADLLEEKLKIVADSVEQKLSSYPVEGTKDRNKQAAHRNQILSEYWYTNLLGVLRSRLDEEDLQDICFTLLRTDPVYEELKSLRKRALSREMIVYLKSRNRLDELINYLRENRPDIKL